MLENVDFVALNFVFHAPRTNKYRFTAATIRASLMMMPANNDCSGKIMTSDDDDGPRFLMHAPHVIYGAVSPEKLQWAFSLGGSLGISQMPMSAAISPGRSMKESYKRYEMMRIQGSVRSLVNPLNNNKVVEDGQLVWSLEENCLQRSGLPRDFTFVMLIQKPAAASGEKKKSNVMLMLDIEAEVKGSCLLPAFPWRGRRREYRPLCRRSVDFEYEIGQRFVDSNNNNSSTGSYNNNRGFNFAGLKSCLEDYVCMPGRVYASKVSTYKGRIVMCGTNRHEQMPPSPDDDSEPPSDSTTPADNNHVGLYFGNHNHDSNQQGGGGGGGEMLFWDQNLAMTNRTRHARPWRSQ